MAENPATVARKIIEKYGFKIERVEQNKHNHFYVLPKYVFHGPVTPGDHRWRYNFEEDVRTAAKALRVKPPECPTVKCKNIYLVYEGDEGSIHRCDFCEQSCWQVHGKKVSTNPPRRWIQLHSSSSPSSGPQTTDDPQD